MYVTADLDYAEDVAYVNGHTSHCNAVVDHRLRHDSVYFIGQSVHVSRIAGLNCFDGLDFVEMHTIRLGDDGIDLFS